MKSLTIYIDLDATAVDSLPGWLKAVGDKTGVYAKVGDITEWGLHNCPPLCDVDPNTIYGMLETPGFNLSMPPMPGAVEVVHKLVEEGHHVYFSTARFGPVAMTETLEWVKKHFPFMNPKTSLIFVADKFLLEGDVLVDDRAETLEQYWAAHPFAQLIGISYPYNSRLDGLAHYRFVPYGPQAWAAIYKIINRTAKAQDDVKEPYTAAEIADLAPHSAITES